ncbi:MAG: hypothetical protein HQK77_08210 [Desulfobacterales bacterium]|nr:hypothetical protein [Desulfobacterales bacterium]
MKITDSESIKHGERELIDSLIGDLNWNVIESILKEKHHLKLQDDVEYKKGDIVVYNNQIAYKLNFDIKINLSILFDRNGDCLTISTTNDESEPPQQKENFNKLEFNDVEEENKKHLPSEDLVENESLKIQTQKIDSHVDTSKIEPNENISQMASQIAEMITEINEE